MFVDRASQITCFVICDPNQDAHFATKRPRCEAAALAG
jgi:hypothetical protein